MESSYSALTDQEGRFEIGEISPDAYKIVMWHPYLASTKEEIVMIQPKIQANEGLKISAPAGRLYANEMMEKPNIQLGITNDGGQSHIVQAFILPER